MLKDLEILSLHPLETANILSSQLILLSFGEISHKLKILLNFSGIHCSCPHSDGQNGAGLLPVIVDCFNIPLTWPQTLLFWYRAVQEFHLQDLYLYAWGFPLAPETCSAYTQRRHKSGKLIISLDLEYLSTNDWEGLCVNTPVPFFRWVNLRHCLLDFLREINSSCPQ